jgi:DDE superfamily endonuclease
VRRAGSFSEQFPLLLRDYLRAHPQAAAATRRSGSAWPPSIATTVAALEEGRTSWTRLLDARRLRPGDDEAAVTAARVREVVRQIIVAGQHQPGDDDILLVFDAGYDTGVAVTVAASGASQVAGSLNLNASPCLAGRPAVPDWRGGGVRPITGSPREARPKRSPSAGWIRS